MSTMLEALQGITFDGGVPDGEMVADAIVILRLVNSESGEEAFVVRTNARISGIMQVGLMHCAMTVIENGSDSDCDCDCDDE